MVWEDGEGNPASYPMSIDADYYTGRANDVAPTVVNLFFPHPLLYRASTYRYLTGILFKPKETVMMTLTNEIEVIKSHVLVVDDELELCQIISVSLQKAGFLVSSAEDTVTAYRMLELESYDAIVSDVMMPGEDGIQFLERVHQTMPNMPVILMTGYAQLPMAVNAIKNGAFDFIHKPFDFDHLRKVVTRAVNYTRLQRMELNYRVEMEQTVALRTAELKTALAELDFAKSALLKVATDKSNFMSNISHEMRTPMNGIVGMLELLHEEGVSGVQADYLAMARQSADDMVAMIDQLLRFNNGTGQRQISARYDLIDLHVLLDRVVTENLFNFMQKGLSLSLQIAEDVPHQIWTDRENLTRLIEILLGNSLKFTDQGGATLNMSCQKSEDDVVTLLCSVTDSGIGIPEGMLERIFEPFVQGDGSFTRRHGGVGLGLSIARQNILLLNGCLWAEHAPDGGSSFKFSFKINTP